MYALTKGIAEGEFYDKLSNNNVKSVIVFAEERCMKTMDMRFKIKEIHKETWIVLNGKCTYPNKSRSDGQTALKD